MLFRTLNRSASAHGRTTVARRAAMTSTKQTSRRKVIDETTLGGAQHKVSLSGPSLGHLISELSATRPGMEDLRRPGMTMSEEHRTQARTVVKYMVGVPVVIGTGIVGYNFVTKREET